ncbi:alpha/beta hydrolase [Nocardia sp. NPDC057353]|uniref:alpha/beta hydrolase n=1 Tax=Nocardia sp. NPDC057353 TaxID=3346104 RepID=UPI003643CA58
MAATRTPVVFIHGLWLHATSWQPWAELFAARGYEPHTPGWPGEPDTVEQARAHPEAVAGIGIDDVAAHYTEIIRALDAPPVLVGHSFGGLFVQKLLAAGLAVAGVAIDPAQIKGVKPLPFAQLRSSFPVLGNPANRKRSVALTRDQFRYGFGNAIPADESDRLFDAWTIPSPGRPLFEAALANFSRNSPAAVDTANPTRGPLLIVSGGQDHTVPDVVTRATHKLYHGSPASTDLRQFPDRGHSLTLDSGWTEVADTALEWLTTRDVGPAQ